MNPFTTKKLECAEDWFTSSNVSNWSRIEEGEQGIKEE
jgi:hypothetical protein